MVIVTYLSIITLNINGLNAQTKNQNGRADKNMCIYAFPLNTSLYIIPKIASNYFILLS